MRVESASTYDVANVAPFVTYRDTYGYDPVGRIKSVTVGIEGQRTGPLPGDWEDASAGRTTTTEYDLNGNAKKTIASDGTVTAVKYDKLDRPTWTTEAVGTKDQRRTGTDYDEAGNVEWTTDGNGIKTVYGYDKLHRQTSVNRGIPNRRPSAQRSPSTTRSGG